MAIFHLPPHVLEHAEPENRGPTLYKRYFIQRCVKGFWLDLCCEANINGMEDEAFALSYLEKVRKDYKGDGWRVIRRTFALTAEVVGGK